MCRAKEGLVLRLISFYGTNSSLIRGFNNKIFRNQELSSQNWNSELTTYWLHATGDYIYKTHGTKSFAVNIKSFKITLTDTKEHIQSQICQHRIPIKETYDQVFVTLTSFTVTIQEPRTKRTKTTIEDVENFLIDYINTHYTERNQALSR